jgi:hypothetical protein
LAGWSPGARHAIDTADEIGKLSQKTGIAVGELSKLRYAAELSGVGTAELAKAVKTLSGQMVEAGDTSSKASRVFQAMGIDTKGGPTVVLEKLATVFQGLQDDEVKTTLATQLFGKAGMDLIPLLNQGKDGIQKLKDEAQRLGIVLNEETSKSAEQFNDNLRAVKAASEGAAINLFNNLAPSLTRISEAMKEAAQNGGTLKAILVGFGGVLAETFGTSEATLRQQKMLAIVKELTIYETQLAEARILGQNEEGALTAEAEKRLKVLREQLKVMQMQDFVTNDAPDNWDARFGGTKPRGAAPNAAAIRAALASTKDLTGATKDLADADAHVGAWLKQLWDLQLAYDKAIADGIETHRLAIEQIDKQTTQEQFANDTRDMTKSQIQGLIIARLEEQQAILRASGAMEQDIQLLQDEINARKKLQSAFGTGEALDAQSKALREQIDLWTQVGRGATDFLHRPLRTWEQGVRQSLDADQTLFRATRRAIRDAVCAADRGGHGRGRRGQRHHRRARQYCDQRRGLLLRQRRVGRQHRRHGGGHCCRLRRRVGRRSGWHRSGRCGRRNVAHHGRLCRGIDPRCRLDHRCRPLRSPRFMTSIATARIGPHNSGSGPTRTPTRRRACSDPKVSST